jgi:uncharacterized protein YsxB (DUF464 family)
MSKQRAKDKGAIHARVYKETHDAVCAEASASGMPWIAACAILVAEAMSYRAGRAERKAIIDGVRTPCKSRDSRLEPRDA